MLYLEGGALQLQALLREVFMQAETLKQQISAAKGEVDAELVLKRAKVVNVFTNEIEEADVAIHHGKIGSDNNPICRHL